MKSEPQTTSQLLSEINSVKVDSMSQSRSSSKSCSEDVNVQYGCYNSHPTWLQPLNNIVGFVVFVSLANCMQSLAQGLLGVVMSTVERHFDLASSSSSWIASIYEIGQIPVLVVVSLLGTRIHRPRSTSVGLLSIGVGCLAFFIPQFLTPAYRPTDKLRVDSLCTANKTSVCGRDHAVSSLSHHLPVFMISRFLIGMGTSPIISIGVTYIDDCCTKEKFAKYVGVFNAMAVIGPALGYLFGAMSLKIFTDFYIFNPDEIGISANDPRWVGAWWLPYTVTAVLCLLTAIPLMGYPRDLPGASEIRAKKVTEAHKDQLVDDRNESTHSQLTYAKTAAEYRAMVNSVFTNPTFLMLTLFSACLFFLISGFSAFGPKYFEFGFAMSPSLAGVMFGIVLLPAGAGGTIIGGLLIEKRRLNVRQIFRIQISMSCLITASTVLFLVVCDTPKFAGVTVPYNNFSAESSTTNLANTCNANCSCDEVLYEPICSHNGLQYYSPCHAGCLIQDTALPTTEFANCSCISSSHDVSVVQATSGVCSAGVCTSAVLFLICFFITVVAIYICITTNMAATLRCVTSSQTVFAFGIQLLIIKIMGTIPGPLLMGVIFDSTCLLWQHDCGSRGSCMFYDNAQLSLRFLFLCLGVSGISLVAMIVGSTCYQAPTITESVDMKVNGSSRAGEAKGQSQQKLFQTDF